MNSKYIPIAFLTFVNSLGVTILLPLIPFIVEDYRGGVIVYGLLIGTYSAFQFFSAPILGALSDKYGRKPILLVSQFGTLVSWIVFCIAFVVPNVMLEIGISLPIIVLLLSRAIDGVTGGNISVANAYISDVTSKRRKTKIFGLMSAVSGVAFLVGPVIGSLSSALPTGYLATGAIAVSISFVTLILIFTVLKESLVIEKRVKNVDQSIVEKINVLGKFVKFSSQSDLLEHIYTSKIFFSLVFSGYTAVIILFSVEHYNLSENQLAILLLTMGSFYILSQSFVVNTISVKIGSLKAFHSGFILMSLSLIAFPFIEVLQIHLISTFFTILGVSLVFTTSKSIITNNVSDSNQGEAVGIDDSISAGASAIAPILVSILYAISTTNTFLIASALLIAPLALAIIKYGSLNLEGNDESDD